MSKKSLYITTTLPYVNAEPHIGFAVEIIRADTIARFRKAQGYDVFFHTGTDEHGLKIYQNAQKAGQTPEAYIKPHVQKFKDLVSVLNIGRTGDREIFPVHFTRTTDPHHSEAAKKFWLLCKKNGFIELKKHQIKYCVGCELEKTDSELVNGHCVLHPNLKIEIIDEENYFFKFSDERIREKLLALYAPRTPQFALDVMRTVEVKAFVERGLKDFSISRLKSKMPWGVEVPDDAEHVMYVWFEALVSYISALGWPDNSDFQKFWQSEDSIKVQYCGKDNLRQQAAIWQAMLLAAGLKTSDHIVVDGFVTGVGGIKMSKSLGNTISPFDIITEYGVDALRYYVLAELSSFEDSPFSLELFKTAYNAQLANGLGNLVSRVMKMATVNNVILVEPKQRFFEALAGEKEYFDAFDRYELNKACAEIWQHIRFADELIQKEQPFVLIKTDFEKAKKIIELLLGQLYKIGHMLKPIMPETAEKIKTLVRENTMPQAPLFPRKE